MLLCRLIEQFQPLPPVYDYVTSSLNQGVDTNTMDSMVEMFAFCGLRLCLLQCVIIHRWLFPAVPLPELVLPFIASLIYPCRLTPIVYVSIGLIH